MPDALTGAPIGGFNSVTGAANTTATTTGETKKPGGELDKDAFLKLLVAQLKYQNPMSPSDPNEFLGQTAQFTMVEKLEAINKAQTDLTVWQKVSAGQGLVGREITGKSTLGVDVTAVVSGLTLSADGPQLVLADGSRMPVANVTEVRMPRGASTGSTALPQTLPSTATAPSPGPGATTTQPASQTHPTQTGAGTPTDADPAADDADTAATAPVASADSAPTTSA